MSRLVPQILALDFDGVICNGLPEYFQTTKLTYQQIWSNNNLAEIDSLQSSFYYLRPVIETGWEMPVLLRALVLGITKKEILKNWSSVRDKIVQTENLSPEVIGKTLDKIRDNYIKNDLTGWLKLHQFYPGVIERLQRILAEKITLYIITTKEGRFVRQLLQEQAVYLPDERIIGKESKRPKYETIRQIINSHQVNNLWFLEDRLKTLYLVQKQPDLQTVKLFLADWGYNTEAERELAAQDENIILLSLAQFRQDFSHWLINPNNPSN